MKKVEESMDSGPIRVATDAWFGCCNFSSLHGKRVSSRPAGTLDRPNCLVSTAHNMIIHGTHTTGMEISGGGQPAKWGTWTLRRVLTGLEVKLGWLAHIWRADVYVWVGSVGAVR